jgi:metal-responsive CopG/Arc/MetJ family transcriptional regulator
MTNISLKLPDDLLQASGECADSLNIPRSEYIRRAIDRMNQETRSRLRKKRLADASRKVRKESMKVNADFDKIEGDPDA